MLQCALEEGQVGRRHFSAEKRESHRREAVRMRERGQERESEGGKKKREWERERRDGKERYQSFQISLSPLPLY